MQEIYFCRNPQEGEHWWPAHQGKELKIHFRRKKFKTFPGVYKNKIWNILGNFSHNLALKQGHEKEVYCRFWRILDHCATVE